MTTNHGELADQQQERKRKKRGAIVKFSLAGVALVGIGAAATSAAWTDDAWFTGHANSFDATHTGDVLLKGSLNGADVTPTWTEAHNQATAIPIPASAFADLLPGETRTVSLWVENAGAKNLDIKAVVAKSGDLFSSAYPVTAQIDQTALGVVAQNGVKKVVLTITAPDWNNSQRNLGNLEGDVTVQFTGTVAH